MRYYSYVEPTEDGGTAICTFSEEAIMNDYWPYWEMRMIAKYGPGHELITKENCLDDWIVVNWALQVDKPE